MKRLIVLAVVAGGLLLASCGFPPNDGNVHLGGGVSVTRCHRESNEAHVQICPPYCGDEKGDSK